MSWDGESKADEEGGQLEGKKGSRERDGLDGRERERVTEKWTKEEKARRLLTL